MHRSHSILPLLHQAFLSNGKKLAVAESCTGGLLSEKLTQHPGASKYFIVGLVTYSNISKRDFLKVSPETIRKFGAVSQEVVIEMIHGLFSLTEADIALSVSGVLGPEKDASSAKPLGTVWMAISHRTTLSNPHTQLVPLQKPRSRIFNRNFVVRYLLQTLYDYQQT